MAGSPILLHQTPGMLSVPYSIFTGRAEGSAGMDAQIGHGPGGNQATLMIQVKPDDYGQAKDDLLGRYEVKRTFPVRLNRTVPATHPLYSWLRCTRIVGCKGVRLKGKAVPSFGSGPGASVAPAYDHHLLNCLFTQPKWFIISDEDLDRLYPPVTASDGNTYRQEHRRWTMWQRVTSVESLTRESGSMIWAEGDAGGPGPVVGSDFLAPWPRFLQKQDIVCRWLQVPAFRGLMSSDAATLEREINLEAGLHCVNDAVFRGYPAGTLLFRGYSTSWNEAPYPSDDFSGRTPSLTVDVDMQFTYFQPPKGKTTEGHNLAPFAPKGGGNGLWYKVTEKTGGRTLFDTYPFEKLFCLPG